MLSCCNKSWLIPRPAVETAGEESKPRQTCFDRLKCFLASSTPHNTHIFSTSDKTYFNEQGTTRGTRLFEFDLLKQGDQTLCFYLFFLREINWKGRVHVWHQPKSALYLPQNSNKKFLITPDNPPTPPQPPNQIYTDFAHLLGHGAAVDVTYEPSLIWIVNWRLHSLFRSGLAEQCSEVM